METKKERMQITNVCSITHCFQNDSWFRTVKRLNNYGNNNSKKKTMKKKKKKEKHLPEFCLLQLEDRHKLISIITDINSVVCPVIQHSPRFPSHISTIQHNLDVLTQTRYLMAVL